VEIYEFNTREKAEEELTRSELQMKEILDNIRDGFSVYPFLEGISVFLQDIIQH